MTDAAGLCVSCGLCCDGTLFNRARTSPQEAPRPRSFGLDVYPDETHFALPCSLLDGAACTIYADRFDVCRTFRCQLLRKVDDGELAPERAHALVDEAKRLRRAAEGYHPGAGNGQARRERLAQLADWSSRPDLDDRRHAGTEYLTIVALERFLEAHFRPLRKSRLAPGDGSGEAGTKGAA